MDLWIRAGLAVYFIVFVAVAFVYRSYVVWRRTGANPVVLGRSDSVYDFIGRLFKLIIVTAALTVLVYAVAPSAYRWLLPIPWLEHPASRTLGVALLLASLVWITAAQIEMGTAWRVGIDRERPTELIRTGLFTVSRNPIFVGMIATIAGLFLVIPNAVTLLIMVLGVVLIQVQVRLEEEFLKSAHGEAYHGYSRNVRRWL